MSALFFTPTPTITGVRVVSLIHSENFLQGSVVSAQPVLGDAGAQSDLSPRPDSQGAPGWGKMEPNMERGSLPPGKG